MSNCSFTRKIPSQQCIGDSLRTINSNFSALDAGLCDLPSIESLDLDIRPGLDLLGYPKINISTEVAPIYQKELSFSSLVTLSSLKFSDSTSISAYSFPYDGSPLNAKPFGTFETISNGTGSPQLTLFWMGSSTNSLATVFAANSSISLGSKGPIWFNDTVDCFYKDGSTLYVGGQFTQVGGTTMRKFASINLDGGTFHPSLGWTGTILPSPIDAGGDLGSEGTVNFITKKTVSGNDLIIVGGSFNSSTKGRSLVVHNETLGIFYSFYFNGELRDFIIDETDLYVVGEFDFCNYGPSAGTIVSGSRIYSKSIAKINLLQLFTAPNACIDEDFAANIENLFQKSVSLYCIEHQSDILYLGGSFRIQVGATTNHQNIIAIGLNGLARPWYAIINGPVHTMVNDPILSYLYVGGKFSSIATKDQYYNGLVALPASSKCSNAIAFTLVNPSAPALRDWKPKFNEAVHKMILHEVDDLDSYVYCMGAFSEVNNVPVGHICSIIKTSAVFDNEGALGPSWPVYLQSGSSPNSNALLKDTGCLFVGGNFTSVNGIIKYHFAKIAGVNESPLIAAPTKVSWDIGGQICSQNQSVVLDFANVPVKRSEVEVGPYGAINKTTFEPLQEGFKGLTKNQLCRFYIKRPGNIGIFQDFPATDDTYQKNVFLLGWTIDFNDKEDK
jgi:hypothetical protein